MPAEKKRSVQHAVWWLVCSGSLVFIAWFAVPSAKWSPPTESLRIGPTRFDSRYMDPTILQGNGVVNDPTNVTVDFRFRIFTRPAIAAYVFSTSDSANGGLRIAIDNYSNIFLEVGSREGATGAPQVALIGAPFEFGRWQKIYVSVDRNRGNIEVVVNGNPVFLASAKAGVAFESSVMRIDTDMIRVGGVNDKVLAGEVADLRVTLGRTGVKLDLTNLKALLLLTALLAGCLSLRVLIPIRPRAANFRTQ